MLVGDSFVINFVRYLLETAFVKSETLVWSNDLTSPVSQVSLAPQPWACLLPSHCCRPEASLKDIMNKANSLNKDIISFQWKVLVSLTVRLCETHQPLSD